jgi:hypothetical protein
MERSFWRSGAVVVSADGRVGFLLSDQQSLTVNQAGEVSVAGWDEFLPVHIFCRSGLPVSFCHSLLVPAILDQTYASSFALVAAVLASPAIQDLASLAEAMSSLHDARAYRLQEEILFAHRQRGKGSVVIA